MNDILEDEDPKNEYVSICFFGCRRAMMNQGTITLSPEEAPQKLGLSTASNHEFLVYSNFESN